MEMVLRRGSSTFVMRMVKFDAKNQFDISTNWSKRSWQEQWCVIPLLFFKWWTDYGDLDDSIDLVKIQAQEPSQAEKDFDVKLTSIQDVVTQQSGSISTSLCTSGSKTTTSTIRQAMTSYDDGRILDPPYWWTHKNVWNIAKKEWSKKQQQTTKIHKNSFS